MDIEFHYHMTYLIAAKAGFSPEDASVLAYASQYVDDNDMKLEVDKDNEDTKYRNYISQTMNILKPKEKLFRIYPLFHFIPGDPQCKEAWRKDGKMHWLNTTPDSKNANLIMDAALATGNLYRIGIACHAYADTWAHQNFVGYYEDYNAMKSPLQRVAPNIGHADAGHNPDWPALVWRDKRLTNERIDNKAKFLEAASRMLEVLARYNDSQISDEEIKQRKTALKADLSKAIGEKDQKNKHKDKRIKRYISLSQSPAYGSTKMPKYDEDSWIMDAIAEDVRGLNDRSDNILARYDPFTDEYTWKDRQTYQSTHWWQFQEAVKAHQDEAWALLEGRSFSTLKLASL
ncbi:MAG: hypothetical protein OET90_02415 [Desulfuromonadales bacterium]|nr:hypothetical protein [Desulfuromonadales bacterium]